MGGLREERFGGVGRFGGSGKGVENESEGFGNETRSVTKDEGKKSTTGVSTFRDKQKSIYRLCFFSQKTIICTLHMEWAYVRTTTVMLIRPVTFLVVDR